MSSDTREVLEENLPDAVRDELEHSELATRVGGNYGEQAGRRIGQQVGAEIESRFRDRLAAGATIGRALGAALKALPAALLEALREAASAGSVVAELKSELKPELGSLVTETKDEATAEAEATAETAAETDSGAAESVSGLPDSADKLRQETIRDLLDVMSYRELQSTAKDVGVKANQSHDDLVDDILDQFAGGDGESAESGS